MPDYQVGPLLVSDSYNRADSASVGSTDGGALSPLAWATGAGASLLSYKIASNQLASNNSPSIEPMWVPVGFPDVRVQIDVTTLPDSGANLGLSLRATGVNDLFWFGVDFASGFKVYLQERESVGGGVINHVVSTSTYTAPCTLRVDMWGNQLYCHVNGTLIGTATSTFNQTATNHGVWTNNDNTGTLDNFKVWQLDPVLPELTHTGAMTT